MKNFNTKSFICGLFIGILSISTVFAAGGIKSANYEDTKVSFNNSVIPLESSLVSIIKEGENVPELYMPTKEILEYLGYKVNYNASQDYIDITSLNYDSITTTIPLQNSASNNIPESEMDKKALEIMQKTGNWSYVEPLFTSMTPEGVKAVVNLYIKKTGNYKQAQTALPYINKDSFTTDTSNNPKTQLDYDTLATETMINTGDIYSIMVYIPHMSTDKIDTLVKDYIGKTSNFNCIYSLRQYLSTKGIDDIVKSYVDKTGDYGTVAAMLQFMSSDASDYVAKKYINEAKDQQYLQFFIPYLQD